MTRGAGGASTSQIPLSLWNELVIGGGSLFSMVWTNVRAISIDSCASCRVGSQGAPGYRNLTAYSVKGVTSSMAGASVPSIRVHSSPNSSRLWVFRKAESCYVSRAFIAFSTACWQWNRASLTKGGVAIRSCCALSKSSLARKSHSLVFETRTGSGSIQQFSFPNDSGRK